MEEIKIENLTFTYSQKEVPTLSNIHLTIKQSEFVVLCGKSGCGKTTLLRCLKPALSPCGSVTGKIYFEGVSLDTLSQREQTEKIGFILQEPDNQIVCDTVWHELAFGLENLSYNTNEIRAKVAEMASFFGIQNWFRKNISELSGGQKQLLNLAAVMVLQPSVLILDEPSSQLDPIAAQTFLETLSKINRELGTTIILSEHRLEEAMPLADKVIVLDNGKVLGTGTPYEIGTLLQKERHEMYFALPTPMRVYYMTESEYECPITIREGAQWLSKMEIHQNICFEENEYNTDFPAVLELRDIWFRYEKNLSDVLRNLTLKIYRGEWYAIVGGNGTGKSTVLSLINKINKPYRGKILIADNKKIAALPQNPQNLFSRKTVLLNLYELLTDLPISNKEKDQRLSSVIQFCNLERILENHPYDLSGGELQRAALAMMLLCQPDILILDEPTKGLDAGFKIRLAELLKQLQEKGITILMVSHDIEFCAKYADRCGMLFDGQIVSEDIPRRFFAGKNFYTTAANRMARKQLPRAVLDTDILVSLGVNPPTENFPKPPEALCNLFANESNQLCKKNVKNFSAKNIVLGIFFAFAFLATQIWICGKYTDWKEYLFEAFSILFLGLSFFYLIPRKKSVIKNIQKQKEKRALSKRTIISAIIIFTFIPFTIFGGVYFLEDKKYYFISLLIITEILLPFALIFEGRRPQARELIIVSTFCAIAVAGRIAFAPSPQFKPIIALIIIAGLCFGGETGFLTGAITGLVSNFFFGMGPWAPWQMFSLGLIGFFSGIILQKGLLGKSKTGLCLWGFLMTMIVYGGIMNFASVIMQQTKITKETLFSVYLMGFPFDFIHAISTVFFLWFIAEPMCEKLERIKSKYNILQ